MLNHHNMQNEFLNIMLAQVLQKMLAVIHVCKFFLIMVDEGTEGTVGDNLNVDKDFLGLKLTKPRVKPSLMQLKISC